MIDYENLAKLNRPFFDEMKQSFNETLEGGWYILGGRVKKFEEEYAAFHGMKHCIGVNSGLDAMVLALKAFGFPEGSEVIVPSNTYIATILAVMQAGLKPVMAEPDPRTYNISPIEIEKKISKKTVAVLPVHLYGKSCDMKAILELKEKYGFKLVEDCAQSHDAKQYGRQTGTFGEYGAFSFYPTKNLGAIGDSGAILTNDDDLALAVRRLRNYGSDVKYYNEVLGYNSRLDEVQAGLLSVKLKHLKEITSHKQKLADLYHKHLSDTFIKPVREEGYEDVFHIYNIRHPERDRLKQYLLEKGIKTEIHYPVAPHHQKAMKGVFEGSYPISEEIHATTLSLPVSFCHTEEEIMQVIEITNNFN